MNVQGEKKKDLSYSEDEKRLKRNVVVNVTKIEGGGKTRCINSNSGTAASKNALIG